MVTEIFIEPNAGTEFNIRTLQFDDLVPFLDEQSLFHFNQGTQDGNSCYLSYNDFLGTIVNCYVVYCKQEIVAFAMVNKENVNHLMRLYTKPEYRRLGIGTALIECLEITSLGCMRENTLALDLYKRLGFKPLDESSVVMTLRRRK